MPVISAMMNAAAPMTGGINWPLVDAATSTAPATCGLKPTFFIKGIVSEPVVTVLAIDEPEIVPIKPDASTAAFAGPPRNRPIVANARSIKYRPAPVRSNAAPNSTNRNTNVELTASGMPKTPSAV